MHDSYHWRKKLFGQLCGGHTGLRTFAAGIYLCHSPVPIILVSYFKILLFGSRCPFIACPSRSRRSHRPYFERLLTLLGSHAQTPACHQAGLRPVNCSSLPANCHRRSLGQNTAHVLMSHTHPTTTSSSDFQLIINNALDTYKKRTRKDLLAHPFAARLRTCDSPAAILAILQEQVQGLDQSQRGDERWSKWLDPTVNVLFAFSEALGAGVGLVCLRSCAHSTSGLIYFSDIFTCMCDLCWSRRPPFSMYPFKYLRMSAL